METVFLLDNKDSFTYNLVHYLELYNVNVAVFRNDEAVELWPGFVDAVVLSPGPGLPKESGTLMKAINRYWGRVPILGVCLGHQALIEFTGGHLFQMDRVDHGVSKIVELDEDLLFTGLPDKIQVGLYHSWAVELSDIEKEWLVNARTEDVIMGVKHQREDVWGVQFHPESVMTPNGKKIIGNFINFIKKEK